MRFWICLSLAAVVFLVHPSSVLAQGHSLYCGAADSTASTQACLKRHLDAAQSRLNKSFKKLKGQLDADKQGELDTLQKTWLSYRDAECMWEVESTENPGLKKINELSCMARLTDDRADILAILNDDKMTAEGAREYGSFPRWMNALANVDGGVYWDYGARQGFDLNCDGEDEFIMQGVETSKADVDLPQEEGEENVDVSPVLFEKVAVLAITQNPSVGKPVPSVFKFPVSLDEDQENICQSDITLKTIEGTMEPISEEEDAEMRCTAKLEVSAKGCDDVKTIVWSGKDFIIEPKQEAEEPASE